MHTLIPTLNTWAERWLDAMGAVLWQSTLLVALAALIGWCLRRSSPVVRYWLWQIVAIKLLLMPFWACYVPLPSWARGTPVSAPVVLRSAEMPSDNSNVARDEGPLSRRERARVRAGDETQNLLAESFAAITWQAWLLLAWFAVVVWQFVRLISQRLRLASLLRQAVPLSGELAELVAESARQMGLRRVPAAVSVEGECPLFVCGLWRSQLVLPSRLLASLSGAEQRQVILHELAHIKRHDLIWGWPVEIARIVYFFHPLVYWVAYQLRLERELACDQLAMARSGHPPADYAQTLVQVVSHASVPAPVQAAAISANLAGDRE
jgi:beta-lactamase regulating signal transducer with metallopeptidase domain